MAQSVASKKLPLRCPEAVKDSSELRKHANSLHIVAGVPVLLRRSGASTSTARDMLALSSGRVVSLHNAQLRDVVTPSNASRAISWNDRDECVWRAVGVCEDSIEYRQLQACLVRNVWATERLLFIARLDGNCRATFGRLPLEIIRKICAAWRRMRAPWRGAAEKARVLHARWPAVMHRRSPNNLSLMGISSRPYNVPDTPVYLAAFCWQQYDPVVFFFAISDPARSATSSLDCWLLERLNWHGSGTGSFNAFFLTEERHSVACLLQMNESLITVRVQLKLEERMCIREPKEATLSVIRRDIKSMSMEKELGKLGPFSSGLVDVWLDGDYTGYTDVRTPATRYHTNVLQPLLLLREKMGHSQSIQIVLKAARCPHFCHSFSEQKIHGGFRCGSKNYVVHSTYNAVLYVTVIPTDIAGAGKRTENAPKLSIHGSVVACDIVVEDNQPIKVFFALEAQDVFMVEWDPALADSTSQSSICTKLPLKGLLFGLTATPGIELSTSVIEIDE